jgi:hypothetical protein
MELLLARPADFNRIYNCSGINIATLEAETSRKFVWEAWATIALCTIYTCLYIPCIYSIIKVGLSRSVLTRRKNRHIQKIDNWRITLTFF